MASTAFTGLPSLSVPAGGDVLACVDISDTTDGLSGTSKQITASTFLDLLSTPVVNVKDARYGALGDGVTDDTVALTAAIVAANGLPVYLPAGTYVHTGLSNVAGKPLILWGAGRDYGTGTTLQQKAGSATVGITLNATLAWNNTHLRDLAIVGTSTALGGLKLGVDDTKYTAFAVFERIRISDFTKSGGYGVGLYSCEECHFADCWIQGNDINMWQPTGAGFVTTTLFSGSAGLIDHALSEGVLLEDTVGDITFRSITVQSNNKDGIKSTGLASSIVCDGVYFENNGITSGNAVDVSGTSGNASDIQLLNCRWYAKGRAASKNLNVDYVGPPSRVAGAVGLFTSGLYGADVTLTGNSVIDFADNNQQVPDVSILVAGIDAAQGNSVRSAITAPRLIGAPINPSRGHRLTFTFVQDNTGGFAITWHAVAFKVSWSDTGNTANKRSSISFIYDGAVWNQDGAQTPYV